MECSNNLKQIGLALHNYHTAYDGLPPAYVADQDGNPLYSWRVLLLPQLEQQNVYDRFDKDKAWDSPENQAVSATLLPVFQCPSSPRDRGPYTHYAVVVGPETLFAEDNSLNFGDVHDGLANSIMVVEIRNSGIHWAEPRDITMDDLLATGINGHDAAGCGSYHPGGMMVCMADGSVHFISEDMSTDVLRSLLTASGGETVTLP